MLIQKRAGGLYVQIAILIVFLLCVVVASNKPASATLTTECRDEGYNCKATCGASEEPKSFDCSDGIPAHAGRICCGSIPGWTPPSEYESRCSELTQATWDKAPSPLAILCPLVRYLNVLLYASAAVFVAMVFISAIKYSLSQGDPKALQGAKGALTWAIIGFIVVIGVFTMLVIFKNVLGLKDNLILNPVGVLNKNLMGLFDMFGITGY